MTVVDDPGYAVRRLRRPPYAMILTFPTTCFIGALITDIAYWQTANLAWSAFSSWLILAGLLLGGIAVFFGLVECLFARRVRLLRSAWLVLLGNIVALVLSALNMMVHFRDGWTAVVPEGLALSAIVGLIVLVTGFSSWVMVYRHRGVGVLVA